MNRFKQTLWQKIKYNRILVHLRIDTNWLFWRIIQETINIITFPFWLIKFFFNTVITLIKNFIEFIINLPTLPKKIKNYILNIIRRLLFDYKYLRKKTVFSIIKKHLIYTFCLYLILSFIDEFKYHTNHEFAQINQWWTVIFDSGFTWCFAITIIYTIAWILSLYFIGLRYSFKSLQIYITWLLFSFFDIHWPDMIHEWMYMFSMTYGQITYFYCSAYCFVVNEIVENWVSKEDKTELPEYKRYSWEYDHFKLKIEEETNLNKKQEYIKTLRYYKLRDENNPVLGYL